MHSDANKDLSSEENDDINPKRIKISSVIIKSSASQSTSYQSDTDISKDAFKENSISPNRQNILEQKKSLGLEEMLVCNICCDVMYNCFSIRPCLHAFCGHCLFDWMESGNVCPMCRGPIEGVSKNHLLVNIINKYLEDHPDKVKSLAEREEADTKVLNGMNKLNSNKPLTFDSDSPTQISLNGCPYCHYPNPQNSNTFPTDISGAPLSDYQCTTSTDHAQCQCCSTYIPILPDTEEFPRQKCQVCNIISCSLMLGSCRNCVHGCLHIFKDFVFCPNLNSNTQVPQFLPENFYETNVLRNYLNDKQITVVDMFKDCLEKLSREEIILENYIDGLSVLCVNCARQTVLEMVYEYVRQIPRSNLPDHVTSRPDCYYGRHCRTQRTRQHHAVNYNHVCSQTRF